MCYCRTIRYINAAQCHIIFEIYSCVKKPNNNNFNPSLTRKRLTFELIVCARNNKYSLLEPSENDRLQYSIKFYMTRSMSAINTKI